MNNIFKNITFLLLASFVLFMSMGVNISKMSCDKSGQLYIGTKIPSCNDNQFANCCTELSRFSCCSMIEEESCCAINAQGTCDKESAKIQYSFETILPYVKEILEIKAITLFTYIVFNCYSLVQGEKLIHSCGIPPPLLKAPVLTKIQSFLI